MVQAPRVELNLAVLKKAYARIYTLLIALGLEIEHGKTEVFHFSRANHQGPDPSPKLRDIPGIPDQTIVPKVYLSGPDWTS